MLVRVPYDRTADRVAIVLAQKMATLPEFFRNSITCGVPRVSRTVDTITPLR